MISVRPFELTDIEEVVILMGQLGYPSTIESMQRRMEIIGSLPDFRTFVADLNRTVVGLIGVCKRFLYESDDVPVQIVTLVTHSDYRGQGIGRSLVKAAEKWANDEGASSIFLTSGIKPERSEAHEFYKYLGYNLTGYRFVKRL